MWANYCISTQDGECTNISEQYYHNFSHPFLVCKIKSESKYGCTELSSMVLFLGLIRLSAISAKHDVQTRKIEVHTVAL
jgi:hypothetical protein